MRLSVSKRIANFAVKTLLRLACKLDIGDLRKIPRTGPVVLITNHTSNIEAPAMYVFMQPRRATALGKIELWSNPVTRFLMKTWEIIPVHRGRVDGAALKAGIAALRNGYLLGVAPEGTRSKSGKLKKAGRGAAMFALRTGAPVYPVAQCGFGQVGRNLLKLRRTAVSLKLGEPFYVRGGNSSESAGTLRRITDEMMYRIARLLPGETRGAYSDLENATTDYLEFF